MAEPGWYRVEGDPPGTKRRWNGEMWIGVPVLQEVAAPDPAAASTVGRLSQTGSIMAVVTVVGLTVQLVAFGSLTWRIHNAVDTIPDNYFVVAGISDLPDFIPGFWAHVIVIVVVAILVGAAFVNWLAAAIEATRALTREQMRRTGLDQGVGSLVTAVVLIFGSPLLILAMAYRYLNTPSRGASRAATKRPSPANMLNLVIERLNAGPGRDVGPIKVMVWWVTLWAPMVVIAGAWLWAATFGDENVDKMPEVLRVFEVSLGLTMVSLLALISTVVAISQRLGVR